jgi:hypothetical protein
MKRKRFLLMEMLKNSGKMRKIFLFLAAVAVCFCVTGEVMAQTSGRTIGGCPFTITGSPGNYTLTISGNGAIGNYSYSNPWGSYYQSDIKTVNIQQGVTSIGDYVFYLCDGLTSITIPNSVTSIGISAFYGCSSLTSITIPDGVTYIGNNAFYDCSKLTSVTIPDGVTSIGNGAFARCLSLTSVMIPDGVTSIGDDAFYGCRSLTSVTIPDGVTSIGNGAFFGCNGLTSIAIPNLVTAIGNSTFFGCGSLTSVTIPDLVTSIGSDAFSGCSSLTSITIPNRVTSIGNSAFYNCIGLTSITIPDLVTSIGGGAFSGCSSLTSITIPNLVASIGNEAFARCSRLISVNFNAINCTTMGSSSSPVFSGCSALTSLNIDSEVKTIPAYAFYNCSGLTSVTIPDLVMSIGESAFSGCSGLTSITIPDGVTSIGNGAFSGCSLTTVNFNAINCTAMGSSSSPVFSNCNAFATLNIGDEVKAISAYAFCNYSGLRTVTVGNSVESIGNSAFASCTNLKNIYVNWTTPLSVTTAPFSGLTTVGITLHVPAGTAAQYRQNSYWNQFNISGDASELPCSAPLANGSARQLIWAICNNTLILSGEGVMPDYTPGNTPWYSYRNSIHSVEISESITSIGRYAFSDCSSITSITIPASVSETGAYAFLGCTKLEMINVAADNPNYASENGSLCNKQVTTLICVPAGKSGSYTVSGNIKTIDASAFYGCIKLTSVIIPNTVTSVEKYAFDGCTKLEFITFPLKLLQSYTNGFGELFHTVSQVTNTSSSVNYAATGYKQSYHRYESCSYCYTTSSGTVTSGYRHYYYYVPSSLKAITISDDAEIKNNFFQNTNLETISIPLVTIIGDYAFSGCTRLVSVKNLNSVTSIGNYAFSGCTNLVSVENLNSVTSIGNYAFSGCAKLVSIEIPNSVISIGNYAFSGCNLSSVAIPDGVTSIGASAFNGCPLKSVITPVVESSLFSSSLEKLTITSACISLSSGCLAAATNLQELILPFIGTSTTSPTTLRTLFSSSVPTTLKKLSLVRTSANIQIAENALAGLTQLTELVLSSNVRGLGRNALDGCSGLEHIYSHWANPPAAYNNSTFEGVGKYSCIIHVPVGVDSKNKYATADGWKEFYADNIWEAAAVKLVARSLPDYGGIIDGSLEYNYDDNATLTAGGNSGYDFQCWMEGNAIVSTSSAYTFTVTAPRTLYAVFTPRENENNVSITPQPTEVSIAWNGEVGASSYTLVIYLDAARTQVYTTLRFAADGTPQQAPSLRSVQSRLSHTVDGLQAGEDYYYSITSYDAEDYALTIAIGSFETSAGSSIETVESRKIRIYPNPVRESFRIDGFTAPTQVIVTDISGRTVLQQTVSGDESIATGHWSKGIYLIRVNGKIMKIVKAF